VITIPFADANQCLYFDAAKPKGGFSRIVEIVVRKFWRFRAGSILESGVGPGGGGGAKSGQAHRAAPLFVQELRRLRGRHSDR